MSRPSLLSPEERAEALAARPLWALVEGGGAIHRTLRFGDFDEAWAFMAVVAEAAKRLDHHPDWRNVWARVEVTLSTHEAGGLTALDLALADVIDDAAARGA